MRKMIEASQEKGYIGEAKGKVKVRKAADTQVKNRNVSAAKSVTDSDWLKEIQKEKPLGGMQYRKRQKTESWSPDMKLWRWKQ